MKKQKSSRIIPFLLGLVLGSILTGAVVFLFEKEASSVEGIVWLEEDGPCLTRAHLKVFHVLHPERALVGEENDAFLDAPIMMLLAPEGVSHFYDEQVIKMPKGKCARHVGNFEYETKDDGFRVIPVVQITEDL